MSDWEFPDDYVPTSEFEESKQRALEGWKRSTIRLQRQLNAAADDNAKLRQQIDALSQVSERQSAALEAADALDHAGHGWLESDMNDREAYSLAVMTFGIALHAYRAARDEGEASDG